MAGMRNSRIMFARKLEAQRQAQIAQAASQALPVMPIPPVPAPTVNVNSATVDELESLPVVGATLSAKILTVREESAFVDFNDFKTRLALTKKQAQELEALVSFA